MSIVMVTAKSKTKAKKKTSAKKPVRKAASVKQRRNKVARKSTKKSQHRGTQNLIPWQPGQSGNPNGRPKKGMVISDAMREILGGQEISITMVVNGRTKTLTVAADRNLAYGIAAKAIQKAIAGDVRAIREVADRVQGRPPQSIRFAPDSGPETDLPDDVLAAALDAYEHNSGDGATSPRQV